jgi:hypothetical protein
LPLGGVGGGGEEPAGGGEGQGAIVLARGTAVVVDPGLDGLGAGPAVEGEKWDAGGGGESGEIQLGPDEGREERSIAGGEAGELELEGSGDHEA